MGIESLLNALASLKSQGPDAPGEGVVLPGGGAGPKAVAEFTRQMQGADPVEGPTALTAPPAGADAGPADPLPQTLGQRVTAANQPPQIPGQETSQVTQWMNSVTDILGRDVLSHADLFRVQALAGLAQVEASRNASINESLDKSLNTLIKNT